MHCRESHNENNYYSNINESGDGLSNGSHFGMSVDAGCGNGFSSSSSSSRWRRCCCAASYNRVNDVVM